MKLTRLAVLTAVCASLGFADSIGGNPVDAFTDYNAWASDSAAVAAANGQTSFYIQSYGFLNNQAPPNWGISNTAWSGHASGIDEIKNYEYNAYDGKFAYNPSTGQIVSYAQTSFVVPPYSVGIGFDIDAIASPYPNDAEALSIQLSDGSTQFFELGGDNGAAMTPAYNGFWGFVANDGQDILAVNFLSGTTGLSTLYNADPVADPVATPEPASLALVGGAVLLIGSLRRFKGQLS